MTGAKMDRWGRYLLPDPTTGKERPWTRVTTIARTISDRRGLERWTQRQLVKGFAAREDLMIRASAAGNDGQMLDRVIDDALDAAHSDSAANIGSAVHRLLERIDKGEPDVAVPKEYQSDVDAYQQTLAANKMQVIDGWIERIVGNEEFDCAGTIDRAVQIEGFEQPLIADIKTGHNALKYSSHEIVTQLALYASSKLVWNGEQWNDYDRIDPYQALIIHLPAGSGRCALYLANLKRGIEFAAIALATRDARKADGLIQPLRAPEHSGTYAIQRVSHIKDYLKGRKLPIAWPSGIDTPSKATRVYGPDEVARILTWCEQTENELGIPPF